MGIISFGVFLLQISQTTESSDSLYISFEVAHIIFVFMALAFIIQALFLTLYANSAGKKFIHIMRTTPESLLLEYEKMLSDTKKSWWFHYGSSLLPQYPAFRGDIEFRIIERLFIYQHKLSPEFSFAAYVNALFRVFSVLYRLYIFKYRTAYTFNFIPPLLAIPFFHLCMYMLSFLPLGLHC